MLALAAALLISRVEPAEASLPAGPEPEAEPEETLPARAYVIERIAFEGLERTAEPEARRHLAVTAGEVLDEKAVMISRLRLLQLGWFSRVEPRIEKGRERGYVVVVFQVVERNTILVSDLVVGSTRLQPFYGGFGLSQQNFLGRGLGLSGAFVYGGTPAERPFDPARFTARGAFFAPDVELGRSFPRLVAGASALLLHGEEMTCRDPSCSAFAGHFGSAPRLRYDRAGGEVVLGIRPGPFERLFAGFRYESLKGVSDPGADPALAGGLPPLRLGRSNLVAVTGTYERDSRDDFFLPREGSRFVAQVTFGAPSLGSEYEYARWLVQWELAFGLTGGRALRLQLAAGGTQGEAPFFERFFAADWAYFSAGPALGRAQELNFSTDSRYDSLLAMAGAEYAIPLWSGDRFAQRGYLAVGARALRTAARPRAGRTDQSSTPFSGDVALRIDTPVGSFNFSLGYALDLYL